MKNFLLYLLASLLKNLLGVIFVTATIIKFLFILKWITGYKYLSKYFLDLAVSKDQYGNVSLRYYMNKWLAKDEPNRYFYGDMDDTISYVTGMNFFKRKATKFGIFIGKTLNKVEKRHMEIAINSKIEDDLAGLQRLIDSGLVYGSIKNKEITFESYKEYVKHVTNEKF